MALMCIINQQKVKVKNNERRWKEALQVIKNNKNYTKEQREDDARTRRIARTKRILTLNSEELCNIKNYDHLPE